MAKAFTLTAKATIPIAACLLAASLVVVARAEDKTQLTGRWNFNLDQSDDADQKIQEAQQNSKVRADTTDTGTYPGSGGSTYPGGGGMGGMGRGGMGGMGGMGGGMGRGRQSSNHGEAVSSEDWDRVGANPKYLRIDQRSDQIVVTDDSDHAQTFYPDGKKHEEKDEDGKKLSTKSSWENGAFVAETKLPHSEKLTQTFRVSDDGKQLSIITRFEAPSLSGPVSIRRVYEMPKSASK
ncbi:MAG: hypothetical protein ACLQVG_14285 [Terriglobia bacterium]